LVKLKQLLEEGVFDKGILKAVFMAGGPGSGKTYVSSQIFGIPNKTINISVGGLKSVNSDTEFEFLLKKYGFATFGTGKFTNQQVYDTDEVPEGTMPWDYEENQAALKGGQFVDLFNTKITTEDQRNLIYDHIAPWGGGGSYGGVTYIKDDKFINTTASVNAYKKSSEKRAQSLGLNKVEGTMFSDLTFSNEVYAPFVTNTTKSVLNNINLIANALDENLRVTGLYRTPEYNSAVGGQDGSTHTKGMGIDVGLNDKFDNWLNTSTQTAKVSKGSESDKFIVYHQTTGQPMFTVLKEDDHFHIESFK